MRRILQAKVIAALAAALVSGGALAQQLEGITVRAQLSHVDKVEVGRSTANGTPGTYLSVSHRVSSAGLDLATSEGIAEMENRVRAAAVHGCHEIGMQLASPRNAEPSEWDCAKLATEEAMAQVRELVAAE